jgi:hypothetical protein
MKSLTIALNSYEFSAIRHGLHVLAADTDTDDAVRIRKLIDKIDEEWAAARPIPTPSNPLAPLLAQL